MICYGERSVYSANKSPVTSTQAASTDLQVSTALATTYVTTIISNPIETTTLTGKRRGAQYGVPVVLT
jgi:hypothetical protein